MDARRLVLALFTAVVTVLAATPALVVFGLGWLSFGDASTGDGVRSTSSSPEAWVLFALLYLAWMLGLMLLTIVVNDRLGRHWRSWDRRPRPEKKRVRRREAGLRYLAGQEKARAEVEREARARPAERAPRAPHDQDPA